MAEDKVEQKTEKAEKPKKSKTKKKAAAAKKPKVSGKLLLVESPTKVNTIKKYLGHDFTVMATKGHILDLPKSRLGVDIANNFEPHYIVLKDKKAVLKEIKEAVKKVAEVYLAADPDREGEAICWHVAEELKRSEKKLGVKTFRRILFNEITKTAVQKAITEPRDIDMNLVNAQQARRVLDRLVGYKLSPLLWLAIRKGLSAGRVQSVALKLIVERQKEIDSFNPVEYWSIAAKLEKNDKQWFMAKLAERDGVAVDLKNGQDAQGMAEELKTQDYKVTEVIRKERRRKALPPFITSTLQQDAARKYRFTAQKTMIIAQQLYEGLNIPGEGQVGLITYMRTDSLRVSAEAQAEAVTYIKEKLGANYLPETPNVYKSKKSAQDAHEAIRPSSVNRVPENIKDSLDADQYKIYSLIWKRFVASQMSQAIFDDTRVKIAAGRYLLTANGSVQKFDGFLKVYEIQEPVKQSEGNGENPDAESQEEGLLPELTEAEKLNLLEIKPDQHFTQPPPYFTDATLVKALEEKDIGRPSTYAPIISTLVYRKYADREKNRIMPTELGTVVSTLLAKSFPEIINEEFTAKMEDDLDRIEEGSVEWRSLLKDFYGNFEQLLVKAEPHVLEVKREIEGDGKAGTCEKCGSRMIIKWGRFGKFLSCEKYPECKNAKTLDGGEREVEKLTDPCPVCGSELIVKQGPYGNFAACIKYPECKYTKQILKKIGVPCPECGGDVIEKTFKKFRKFFGCSNYPKCKFMTWDKPVNEPCPKCGAPFTLEKWKKKSLTVYCTKCDYREEKEKAQDE